VDKLNIEGVIEAVLFCAGEPVPVRQLCELLKVDEKDLRRTIDCMEEKLSQKESGIMILALEDCYQMCSRSQYGDFVRSVLQNKRKATLSPAALEVLSIVAYHQPTTRALVEQIRGVECSSLISSLCDKELIEEVGHMDSPGRPRLYGTTLNFLRCFGLNDLSQLPSLPQTEGQKQEELLE
jgi:segregation and condensation protein B